MREFNFLEIEKGNPEHSGLLGRLKRHATVKVKGLRGTKDKPLRVLKADWPYIWVIPVEDLEISERTGTEVAPNRAAERRRGNYRPSVDHKLDGQRVKLDQVTHVALSPRSGRRRRRSRW